MPIEPMLCPKCRKPASEYDEGKWKCLNCGVKFIYEAPPSTDKHEYHLVQTIDAPAFTCKGCGGSFPKQTYAQYACSRCGGILCPNCFSVQSPKSPRKKTLCPDCCKRDRRFHQAFALFLFVMIAILWQLAQCQQRAEEQQMSQTKTVTPGP